VNRRDCPPFVSAPFHVLSILLARAIAADVAVYDSLFVEL
jgi:hypothetical protein